eukprot:scaffold15357_cov193-Alexandrium_tamarense.AAC.2
MLLCNVGNSGIGTGFYRNGYCATGDMDMGRHTVCVRVTDDFLTFSKSVGNDLSTPMREYHFPGLKESDIWCLCAQRWAQAYNAGKAPQLFLQSTHEKTLDYIPLEILKAFAIDADESNAVIDKLNLQRNQLNELMNKEESEEDGSFQVLPLQDRLNTGKHVRSKPKVAVRREDFWAGFRHITLLLQIVYLEGENSLGDNFQENGAAKQHPVGKLKARKHFLCSGRAKSYQRTGFEQRQQRSNEGIESGRRIDLQRVTEQLRVDVRLANLFIRPNDVISN